MKQSSSSFLQGQAHLAYNAHEHVVASMQACYHELLERNNLFSVSAVTKSAMTGWTSVAASLSSVGSTPRGSDREIILLPVLQSPKIHNLPC